MKKALIALAVASLSASAFAAKMDDAPAAGCDGLRVATGPATKGYSKLFKDIDRVCGKEVALCEVVTSGGLDNLSAMSTKDADIGIAQLDTLVTMKNGDENIASLQAVDGLNFNYMHVVTRAGGFAIEGDKKWGGFVKGDTKIVVIQRFSELKGRVVAVVGSAALLARQLDRQLGFGMQFIDAKDDAAAFKMVDAGQAAAALTVSGWPHGALKTMDQSSGLTLVPFDATVNAPYVVRSVNYKSLGVYNNNMLAVPNLLLTRPFKGEKNAEVAKLKSCIARNLQGLQEGNFEPAWNEIKSLENTYEWPRFSTGSKTKK